MLMGGGHMEQAAMEHDSAQEEEKNQIGALPIKQGYSRTELDHSHANSLSDHVQNNGSAGSNYSAAARNTELLIPQGGPSSQTAVNSNVAANGNIQSTFSMSCRPISENPKFGEV